MASDGVASATPEGGTGEATALEDVVLDSSRTLMSAHPDEFGTKLDWTLESVAGEFGADRCGTYQADPSVDGAALVLSHEWSAEEVDPRTEAARVLEPDRYPWLFQRLRSFQNARATPVFDLPEEATAFRELLVGEDVESAVVLPLVSNWTLLGAVSFEATNSTRPTDDRRVDLLRTFSDMLGHALARTRRERELRQKNERLEEFASVVSHDLRNPLNVVQASIELARHDPVPAHFDRGAEAADRMERIIQQVLTLARLGQDIGETDQVTPTEVAIEAWESIEASSASIEVVEAKPVDADRDRLREAFENLFRNAIEHGGADVTVRVEPLADVPGFAVSDDGSGIPDDERERIFDQGHTTAEGGIGLGLSIVSRIVDAHGWEIAAMESEDGGARFEIRTEPDAGD